MRNLSKKLAGLVLACMTGLIALPACAHTLSESLSSWQVQGKQVQAQFTIPDIEVKRLSASGKDVPPVADIATYLSGKISVTTGGQACTMTQPAQPLAAISGFFRFEMGFQCASEEDIALHFDAFYELVSTHTDFAQIQSGDGQFSEQLFTDEHRVVELGGEEHEDLASASFFKYIQMGIMHIFTGIDHMSFMLGFVLISRNVRELLIVITGFTVGHSITLALAVTGILRPEGQYIDALVAFTIAMIGAENIGDSTHKPIWVALSMGGLLILMAIARALHFGVILPVMLLVGGGIFGASYLMMTGTARDASRIRVIMTLVFGLIHGFGFAANLLQMHLPKDRLAELLVGFNVGVEIGQVTVVLTALAVAYGMVKIRLGVPRPILVDVASSFLVAEGLFWFVTRSMVW
ncbi:MAG TPA: HupE/UreJ family protein [Candidatus Acidoferrum sp.]|nr:HupE/UreJ family protein [Candidatus Acidoferrum sp.]